MAQVILVDTGYFLALLDRNDSFHKRAVEVSKELTDPLVTTWPVLTETCLMIQRRLGDNVLLRFMDSWVAGAFTAHGIDSSEVPRARTLIKQYADLPMDLADCSLVLLAEKLGQGKILTTDQRDFGAYRWKSRKPFLNLLALE